MEARQQIADFLVRADRRLHAVHHRLDRRSRSCSRSASGCPYNRIVNAVLDFLRDVSEPFLRIFRRLGLRVGPIDFSPIIAILVLRIGGGLIVSLIAP